ncbi:cytochrome P450 [Auricularia subglabra TFB-10046 SS5]|nr:cytochrome P450 [Auricularia subglabra TFB-10046 SS5]
MILSVSEIAAISLTFALCVVFVRYGRSRSIARADLPPGPQEKSFILGNVSDVPSRPEEWKKYHAMCAQYGTCPVMHLRALNKHIIILDTIRATVDLLEKRGAIYSDRPRLPFLGELMGYDWTISMMPYGDFWRRHRRALHQHMNEVAMVRLQRKQERLNTTFQWALLESPEDWWNLTHWQEALAGANIMSTVYGLEGTKFRHDPWIQLGEDALQIANEAFGTGFHPVDFLPFLKHVPSWFPGAAFKRKAREAYKIQIRTREEPFAWVKDRLAEGNAVPCITTALLDSEVDGASIPEEIIKNSAGMAYLVGADTTLSTIKSFFLAMVRNPDIQRKAQEELDRVLPSERLPTLTERDRSNLPYIEAVLRETYRKYPPVPLGLPHKLMEEDEYFGMRIPSGAVLIPNIWAMTHDDQAYPEPQVYRPERFLRDGLIDTDVPNPRNAIFGFGRRICPGRYFADAEIWLMMATMLYCFDILPAIDEQGREIIPTEAMTEGTVIAPVEFQCRILPRSAEKRALILHAYEQLS